MDFSIEFNVFVWGSNKLGAFLQIVDAMRSIVYMQIWKRVIWSIP